MADWVIYLGGMVVILAFSFFFSGAETGFMTLNLLKIRHWAEHGDHKAAKTVKLMEKPVQMLGTTLVGNNICVVSATVLTGTFLEKYLDPSGVHLAVTFGLTFVMLIVGEIIPKSLFQLHGNELTVRFIRFTALLRILFYPVMMFVNGFSHLVLWAVSRFGQPARTGYTREDLELLAGIGAEEGIIDKTARAFIHSVFSFGNTTAREIMTPLVDVVMVEEGKSINAVVKLINEHGFSRIPVYRNHAYSVVGYVTGFDLIHSRKRDKLSKYVRSAVFVPETKKIDSLLLEMRRNGVPLVFVVDEWGGTAGIITHEDIAEHIVGNIRDMGEKVTADIQQISPGEFLVDGIADVDLVEEKLGVAIEKEGFETASGFVEYLMQRIPVNGETVQYRGFRITVEEAEPTVVHRIRFTRLRR